MPDEMNNPEEAVVYTDTVVHSAPERFLADAPYQIAIVTLRDGSRLTVRIRPDPNGERAMIGEPVVFDGMADGVPYFRRQN